jgi:hypothetical protein
MKTFARSGRNWRAVGTFIVLQGEFWPNGIYAGISEVAYAVQDLSVNRVGIFPTRRFEREQSKSDATGALALMRADGRELRGRASRQGCGRADRQKL